MSRAAVAWAKGDVEAARSSYASALDLYRRLGDVRSIAQSLSGLGDVARGTSDFAAARSYYEEALSMSRELEDRKGIAESLFQLCLVTRNMGDSDGARALAQECLRISRELGIPSYVADALGQLARLASDEGEYTRAEALLQEVLALVDTGPSRAGALSELGDVAHLEGKDDEGARLQRESLSLWRAYGATAFTMRCMERLAFAILGTGDAARACRLLGAAEARRDALGTRRPPIQQPAVDQCREKLRGILGLDRFAAAWAEGQAMSLDQAMDYALVEPTTLAQTTNTLDGPAH